MHFVLPDFYYKIADTLLYNKDEELKSALQTPDAHIRYLINYWFGFA